jgi:hypothetical protein
MTIDTSHLFYRVNEGETTFQSSGEFGYGKRQEK